MVAAIRAVPTVSPLTHSLIRLTTPKLTKITTQRAVRAANLLRTIQFAHPPSCPCHSNPGHHHNHAPSSAATVSRFAERTASLAAPRRGYATPRDPAQQKEYAFEMAASSIRFGPGVTREVGMDLKNMGAKRVAVVTDATVDKLDAMRQVREALDYEGIEYRVYSDVKIEPKDYSYVSVPSPSTNPRS